MRGQVGRAGEKRCCGPVREEGVFPRASSDARVLQLEDFSPDEAGLLAVRDDEALPPQQSAKEQVVSYTSRSGFPSRHLNSVTTPLSGANVTERVVVIHVRTSWCDSVAPDVATLSHAARVSPHVGGSGLRAHGCRKSVPQGEKDLARALDTGRALATDALPAAVTIRPHNYIV